MVIQLQIQNDELTITADYNIIWTNGELYGKTTDVDLQQQFITIWKPASQEEHGLHLSAQH